MGAKQWMLVFCFLMLSMTAWAATDNFDDDPIDSLDWEIYDPMPGITYSMEDGWWQVTIPAGVAHDHWTTIDNAFQLRRSDIPDNFLMETRLHFNGSGDPLAPTWPPANESYKAVLMVSFSQFDMFYWGPRMGSILGLQRSGTGVLCQHDPGLQDVCIGIKKNGTTYSFLWKANEEDPWLEVCTQETFETPVYVGYLFKSWNPVMTQQETFSFDYFKLTEAGEEPPQIQDACYMEASDTAWVDMPYVRPLNMSGYPVPDLEVTDGPDTLLYNPETGLLQDWIPEEEETVPIGLEATNSAGSDDASWAVTVKASSEQREETFDDLEPNLDFWEFNEPQTGVAYSIIEEEGNNWLRLDVPQLGDLGASFDVWTFMDNSVQYRHFLDAPDEDFLLETRIRFDPNLGTDLFDQFGVGLLLYFGAHAQGGTDMIHWQAGHERTVLGQQANIIMERSGMNNLALGYFPDLMTGAPLSLRLERRCDLYNVFWKSDDDFQWRYAGSYQTSDQPMAVGMLMKTWADGCAFAAEVDYFDLVDDEGVQVDDVGVYVGDTNNDNSVNLADAISILTHLFVETGGIACLKAADSNDDDKIDLADAITVLTYQFTGGDLTDPEGGLMSSAETGCHDYPKAEVETLGCDTPCQ